MLIIGIPAYNEEKNALRDDLDDLIDDHNNLLEEYGELNTTTSPWEGDPLRKDNFSTISRSFTLSPGSIEPEGIYLASAIK